MATVENDESAEGGVGGQLPSDAHGVDGDDGGGGERRGGGPGGGGLAMGEASVEGLELEIVVIAAASMPYGYTLKFAMPPVNLPAYSA
jgi:hypothetical protein